MKFEYSKNEDALYVYFKEVEVSRSQDEDEGVVIDYDALGDVVGIEVLDASSRIDMSDCEGVGGLVHRLLTQAMRAGDNHLVKREGRGEGIAPIPKRWDGSESQKFTADAAGESAFSEK